MDDKRRRPRAPISLLVQLRFDALDEVSAEYSADLSSGGMFIPTREPKAKGALVFVQFMARDGSRFIDCMGRVAHVNGLDSEQPGMGIQFLDLEPDAQAYLEALCGEPGKP